MGSVWQEEREQAWAASQASGSKSLEVHGVAPGLRLCCEGGPLLGLGFQPRACSPAWAWVEKRRGSKAGGKA